MIDTKVDRQVKLLFLIFCIFTISCSNEDKLNCESIELSSNSIHILAGEKRIVYILSDLEKFQMGLGLQSENPRIATVEPQNDSKAILITGNNVGNTSIYLRDLRNPDNFAEIEKQSLYLDQLFLLLKKETSVKNDGKEIDLIENIKVIDLSYRYNDNGRYVLKNINLELKRGCTYAILGKNGSGKTTLANILMGFYDDYEGEIFINGLNLKTLDKESYRERLGALFQDFGKYEASIRENIAYGNLDLLHADSYIMEIAREFDILSLIERAPNNLETQLGYWFDEGKQISIGQWQKVALCRAFIKNADVYILDEPNAALDAISEYYIAQLYKKILYEKLGIIIAHKFGNFVQDIDRIFVLEDGEIVQQGSHTQLLSEGGIYKYLYELQ